MNNITVQHFDTRFARIVWLFLLFVALQGLAAIAVAAPCDVRLPKPGEPLAGRSFSMMLRDGREITVIGQNHGDTRKVVELANLASDERTPNSAFLVRSKKDVRELEDTLRGFREEASFLRARAKIGKLDYVALEWGPTLMGLMSEQLPAIRAKTAKNFTKRGIGNTKLRDDAFLLLAAPAKYLELNEPLILRRTKIVGIENDDKMAESVDHVHATGVAYQAMMAKFPMGDARRASWEQSFLNVYMNSNVIEKMGLDGFVHQNTGGAPISVRREADVYLRALYATAMLLRARDRESTPKLLAQPGSGVLLIGLMHVQSIADLLEKTCLNTAAPAALAFHL